MRCGVACLSERCQEGAARRSSSSHKHPRHVRPSGQRKRSSRLVATNHNINNVGWLQSLDEDITWIKGDPIQEISQQLNQNRRAGKATSELHIVAHGSNGEVKLGSTFLTKHYLDESSQLLQEWNLEAIFLWSCEAGLNIDLTTILAERTKAEVYSSKAIIDKEKPNISSNEEKVVSLAALIGQEQLQNWSNNLNSNVSGLQVELFDGINPDPTMTISPLLSRWHHQLRAWAVSGQLLDAARAALELKSNTQTTDLCDLIAALAEGNMSQLPEVELLRGAAMPGAAGAYAASTRTIYLNRDWLRTAADSQIQAVLTEEFGHHLDAQFNAKDTKGDEGKIFAQRLNDKTSNKNASLGSDHGFIRIGDDNIRAEFARATNVSLVFEDGYIGSIGNNPQKNDDARPFSHWGIERIIFKQVDALTGDADGYFETTQGNDIGGTATITTDSGNTYDFGAVISWNDKNGSDYRSFGLLLSTASNGTSIASNSANSPLSISLGSDGGDTNISLLTYGATEYTLSGGTVDINGNASGVVTNLNGYLDASVQVSTIAVSNITEGENLIYNISLESAVPTGTTYVYDINATESLSGATFSNSVTYNSADSTVSVPAEVSSFTVTFGTTDDATPEATQSATLTIGTVSETAQIYDNDNTYVDGLQVELFDGINFDGLIQRQQDETIYFDDSYITDAGGNHETWSTRSYGQIQAYTTGTNTWETRSDDRVRIWINGEAAQNWSTDHSSNFADNNYGWLDVVANDLVAGEWYDIKVEFAENTDVSRLKLAHKSDRSFVDELRFNTKAPIFQSAATSTDGTKVVLTYDEALSYEEASDWVDAPNTGMSSTTATPSDFAVTAGGAANAVTAVAVSGATVELTLTNTVTTDQTVLVSYTDPNLGSSLNNNDVKAIQGIQGNDAASITNEAVTNNSNVIANGVTITQTGPTDGADLLTTEAGSTTTFTVVLDAQPTANVTVSISGLDTTENSLSADTLTFTTANWNTPQTVTVTGVDDTLVDGDITTTLTATASNTGGYAGTETDTTTVKNTDDDTNGITISQTGSTDGADLLTTEAGSTTTFTVVLDAQPTANVTVSITGLDTTENSLSADTLTFTTANWNTPQTVTVTGVDDTLVDGDITTTLTATASNTGGYAGTETDTTTVKNTDDDTNGITIAQTGTTDGADLLTTEAGSTTTFTVVLDAQPTANVTVSITGLDTTENSLSADTLTFTTANWNTPQTVTVTGVDDTLLDGDITTTLTATASNTGGYAGTETDTTTVKNTDDDTNGITIAQTGTTDGADLLTTEAGSTTTFTVVLDAQPTANVTVSISGLDTTENSLSADTLTFTTANWNTPQTVTVTGVDDTLVDGDITTTLTATASNTGGYAGTETATTTVKNTDDDTNGITIAQTGTTDGADLLTTEAGSTTTFTVVLDAQPTANVTVSITGLDTTENSLSADTLTFTTANWNTPQTVTVTGVDDTLLDGDITTTLTATASNTGGYAGTETDTTTVKNTDDDTNGITIAQTGTTDGADLLTTEAGSTTTFTVVLDAQPTANVTVSISGLDTTENSLSADTLTFTTANWNTPQTVTVTGVDDTLVDGDITTTLTATASNTGGYAGTETATTTVKNTDDDTNGVTPTLEIADVTVNEGSPYVVYRITSSGQQTFTLALNDQATGYLGSDNDANALDAQGAYVASDYKNEIQIYDGKTWTDHSLSNAITTSNASSVLLARVPLINDTVHEGAHAFRLKATRSDNTSVSGIAIIGDFGTGAIFNESGVEDPKSDKNDDRLIQIDSPFVNEASDYVVFTVTGHSNGSTITLTLQDENSGGNHTNITTPNLEFWNGNNWQTYNAAIVAGADFDDSQPLFVRVTITEEQDNTREGSEDFSLLVNATEGSSIGVATINDDGTGVKYTGTINTDNVTPLAETQTNSLDDDYDRDGIPPTTEEALATLAASQGIAGNIGDMNGDGKQDSEQNALATLAWRSVSDFESGNAGTLTDSEAIICIGALSSNSEADDDNLQLENIRVLDFLDTSEFGDAAASSITTDALTGDQSIQLASGESLSATWDPLGFELKPREGIANLTDVDPQRTGTQANIHIDTRASNLNQNDVNRFIKFVSQDSINQAQTSGQPLEDLDSNLIDQEGWYDFTQRRDNTGALTGDGAELVFDGQGQLQGVNLTLTDNRFGDSDPAAMQLSDPGALAFQAAAPTPSPSPSPSPTSPRPTEDTSETDTDHETEETPIPTQPNPISDPHNQTTDNIYILLDTSNSTKFHTTASGRNKRIKILKNSKLAALDQTLRQLEQAGYELRPHDGASDRAKKKSIQSLLSSPAKFKRSLKDFELASLSNATSASDELNIHLITYDYVVRHQSWTVEPGQGSKPRFLKQIAGAKTPFQRFGNDTDSNPEWKQAGLPKPTKLDFLTGDTRPTTPSNLYAGTELYGALEGLRHLLEHQQKTQDHTPLTQITVAMDGLAERRPWWDADLSQPIDIVSGTAIKLPQSLGGHRIKHSGLSHQSDGSLDAFRDSDGIAPWTTTIEDIKTSLKELANADGSNVITRFIGQSVNQPPMTPDLLDDYLFSPESDGWTHKNVVLPCDALACPSTLA